MKRGQTRWAPAVGNEKEELGWQENRGQVVPMRDASVSLSGMWLRSWATGNITGAEDKGTEQAGKVDGEWELDFKRP